MVLTAQLCDALTGIGTHLVHGPVAASPVAVYTETTHDGSRPRVWRADPPTSAWRRVQASGIRTATGAIIWPISPRRPR